MDNRQSTRTACSREKSEKREIPGRHGGPATGDRQVGSLVHDVETLPHQQVQERIIITDEQPVDIRAEVGKLRGAIGIEDVAIEMPP